MKFLKKRSGMWFHIFDVLFNVVVIVIIVAGIRTFLISPFQVEGSSMSQTLEDNEYIIINKLTYFIGKPNRGDAVVFRPPNDPKKYYVKRVIGLPGEDIVIRDGRVFVRGYDDEEFGLSESYLDPKNQGKTFRHPPGSGDTAEIVYHIPDGRYFLLGDNRQGSLDSRSFTGPDSSPSPFVPEKDIKGRVWFVALPITKIHALQTPEYGL